MVLSLHGAPSFPSALWPPACSDFCLLKCLKFQTVGTDVALWIHMAASIQNPKPGDVYVFSLSHFGPSAPRSSAFFWLNRARVRCMWLSHKPTHSSKILSRWKSSFDSVLLIPAFQFVPSVGGDQGGYSLLRTNRDAAISKTEIGSISV